MICKIDIILEDKNYTIMLLRYVPSDPGKNYGNPEDCYPPEDAEVWFDLVDENDMLCDDVSEVYEDVIIKYIEEYMHNITDDGGDL